MRNVFFVKLFNVPALSTFVLSSLFAVHVQASQFNVSIQCRPEGPIYSGKIEFPSNISDWTVIEVNPPKNYTACLVSSLTPIRLEFNGMMYSNLKVSTESTTDNGRTCQEEFTKLGLRMAVNRYTLTNQSGYQVDTVLVTAKNNQMLVFHSFTDGFGQSCKILK